MKRRIGLYGGTFDPVHVGHLTVASTLSRLFALDELLFIPAHVAPHKRESVVSPGPQRYAMLVLATMSEPRMGVSTVELDEPERPYTVETLARLKEKFGRDAQLFFIMGADSWTEIQTWREWERVLSLTNHIVMARPGYDLDSSHVPAEIRDRVVDLRGAREEAIGRMIDDESAAPGIYVTDAVNIDISATDVRRLVREGRDDEWPRLVPPQVAEFIKKYRLYRDTA